ncbi:regulator of G protein signaling superfamily [Colletotrichum falcatum]|nr:regulator of G protein signaling superfamily [Colletotrichum falcatum]
MSASKERNTRREEEEDAEPEATKPSRFNFPDWLVWYKKPEYRDFREYATAIRNGRRPMSRDGRDKTQIPARLSLERVLANQTCSPMSLYDFYMYLKYIEFSPENLEFYVWFRNYEESYAKTGSLNNFPIAEKEISQSSSSRNSLNDAAIDAGIKLPSIQMSEFDCDPEAANETMTNIVNLIAPESVCQPNSRTGPTGRDRIKSWANGCAKPVCSKNVASVIPARIAPNSAYRTELNAIVQKFLLPDAEKELNIPPALRDQALLDLQHSSDPAHLKPIADHVYGLLRNCSHRNFVRLGVSNGTFETLCMATSVGIVLTITGFLCVFLRAFFPFTGAHSRWNAFAPWPMWFVGMSLILSGMRGSCFFLLLFTRRQPLPWERFDDSASLLSQRSGFMKFISRMMIFDRKIRVKDTHLRKLQHKIVLQAMVGGAIFASLSVLLFVLLPVWEETVKF